MTELISVISALGIGALLTPAIAIYNKKKGEKAKLSRTLALLLAAITFARYIFEHAAVYFVRGLDSPESPFNNPSPNQGLTAYAILLVWFGYAAMLAIVIGEFWKSKTLRAITELFALPMYLLLLISWRTWGIASLGAGYALSSWRLWFMVIECGVALSLPLSHLIKDEGPTLPKGAREIFNFFYALFFAILTIMPCYVPQAFFHSVDADIRLFDFTEAHRIILYFGLIIPYVIFHLLKNKSYEVKRYILIYMSLGLLWIYIGRWNVEMLKSPLSWPLHLCNTAMFLIPLCLIFRMRRLYNFCLFINVMGALLAMFAAGDLDGLNAIGTERISYWVNHYAAFFMPLLMVGLKIFRRPKFKEWVYAVIALTVYFLAMLVVNAWFSNYGECDYFFLNSDFIVSKLGRWAERTRDLTVSFSFNDFGGNPITLTFYPLYQALFYIVYIGFTVGIWFIYTLLFSSWDAAEERRMKRET